MSKGFNLLYSLTESLSKETRGTGSWLEQGLFTYDKADDIAKQITGRYGIWDSVVNMVAENPFKTAYVAGTTPLAIWGKTSWAIQGKNFWNSIGLVKSAKNMTSLADATATVGFLNSDRYFKL